MADIQTASSEDPKDASSEDIAGDDWALALANVSPPIDHSLDAKLLDGLPSSPSGLARQVKLNEATTEGFAPGVVYTERFADGSVYVGTFARKGREGDGKLTYSNGDVYQGQFRGDARHLYGHLVYASGDTYDGKFYRDELEGHGVFKCWEGWCYEGEFHLSNIHGRGVLAFARTDFPSELLQRDQLCGPSQPAVMASKIPGSLQELLDVTQNWGRYRGEFQNGLRHGHGRLEFEVAAGGAGDSQSSTARCSVSDAGAPAESHFFECEWADGQRHGRGIVHIAGHLRYEGEFHLDDACGQGKLVRWFHGGEQDVFEGEFSQGAVHGLATYSGPDGTIYEGQFCEGLRQGGGQLHVRGTGYSGQFFKGVRHGVGRYRSPKVAYSGHYSEDQRHGPGLLREFGQNGEESVYEGEFVASMRQGQGKFKSSVCSYAGSWNRNVRYGHGRQTWHATGDSYEGLWQGDKMHGEGTLMTSTIKYVGQFSKGEQDGKGIQTWWKRGGDTYEGRFRGSRPHGLGVYTLALNGETYVGQMERGVMGGDGTYTYSDGGTYEGQWLGGRQNGEGRLAYKDGSFYEGQFQDDAFHGRGAFVEPNGSVYAGTYLHNKRSGEIDVLHADGQRELRGYDSEGQEVESKVQARVLPPGEKVNTARKEWNASNGLKILGGQYKAKAPGCTIQGKLLASGYSPRSPPASLPKSPLVGMTGRGGRSPRSGLLPELGRTC